MKTTFYVASPYRNRVEVQFLADILRERGLVWANDQDWTVLYRNIPDTHVEAPKLATEDVLAAIAADLFVLLLSGNPTAGATAEMVARWSHGRTCHMIWRNEQTHLFHRLPGLVVHRSIEDFVGSVLRRP